MKLPPLFVDIKYYSCLAAIFVFIQFNALSQQTTRDSDSIFKRYAATTDYSYNKSHSYYIAYFEKGLPSSAKVIRRLDDRTAIVEINSPQTYNLFGSKTKLIAANDNWKLSPSLEKTFHKIKVSSGNYNLSSDNIDALLQVLKMKEDVTVLGINRPSNSVIIKARADHLKELLALKEVIFIDAVSRPHAETNIIGYDRSFHGINAVDYLIPGANGKGIVSGVKEQKIDENDIDLKARVLASPIAGSIVTTHANVIASIIGGAGNSFYDGRGIAWGCNLFSSSFANLFADDAFVLSANRVTVQNHSYGTIIQQFYGAEAVSYDALTWNNKTLIPVVSSGNQGGAFANDGKYANIPGFANLTGNFKMAKNIITVGAIDNKENIPAPSSAGPLYDGRIAPQLTALGPNGTSDAAAIVTGTIAVIQQVYADSNSQNLPPASLTKAILYNTADDIHQQGIDYKTGYGLLNSFEAIKAIQQKKYDGGTIANGTTWKKDLFVPDNAAQVKVTLSWTDTTATVNNNNAIINDIDLELIESATGTIYQPWVLSTAANRDSLSKLPVRKRDSLNTAEQISIQLPASGNYQIVVKGTDVKSSSLPFHIAYNIDTLNTFTFTSPLHASDVNRAENENLTVRWKTFVADTNETGDLYISYDLGSTWDLLTQSHRLASKKYQWQIKDTASTGMFKMEAGFGAFISNPFIISKVIRPTVDFNCRDSFRISWNHHVHADAYKIYTLTDSPYLKNILTVADTFAVLQRSAFPTLIYAVEPVLNNGLAASRSVSINVNLQGVQCFYKTLNYNLLDLNKLNLLLELSIAEYADSVYFEQVTANGQLVQTYGGVKVDDNKLIYNQNVDQLLPGITYLRSRIKLRNGVTVYTDIISVLTTGNKFIRFYPNPANRTTQLKRVLQQGLPTETRLQLYDSFGRLLKNYSSLPDKIDLSRFSPGVIIYKLIDINNNTLETGRVIIQ